MQLNYNSPINSLGYGYTGYHFLKQLSKMDIDISLSVIGQIENLGCDMSDIVKLKKPYHQDAPSLRIWHQNDVHTRITKGKHFGFPIFELDTITKDERESISACDEVIVCSEWAKEVLINNGIKIPIHVVPLGYDPEVFIPTEPRPGTTIFFNCGKWEYRKGHDVILECFNKAFSKDDDVALWMMCHNPFKHANGEAWEKMYKTSSLSRKIRIIPRQRSQVDVAHVMRKTDCGIFPARAEGWNLELLEMMGCGKHNIATNYSGHTQFCNNTVRLIDISSFELAIDNVWFYGTGSWAKICKSQIDSIVMHMRDIHKKKQSGNLRINQDAVTRAREFSWENSAQKLFNVITS